MNDPAVSAAGFSHMPPPTDEELNFAMQASEQTPIAIREIARASDCNPAKIAVERGIDVTGVDWWDAPMQPSDTSEIYSNVNLIGISDNILSRYSRSIAESVQFPVNTAYLHGLGVVASAMTRNFRYVYHGTEKPVNLYVVTAQPPSTGKSAVNTLLTGPLRAAVDKENEYNKPARLALRTEITKLEKEVAKAEGNELLALAGDLVNKENEMIKVCAYRYGVTDATPEALEEICGNQGGVFSIISDESDAINVILGNVYGDKKANMGLILSAWDGDYFSSARITRTGHSGAVNGSIAVLAQDESISSILEAGQSGRGVSERFIILRERNLLGQRDHMHYKAVDQSLKEQYAKTIESIYLEEGRTLTLSKEAYTALMEFKQEIEPLMADAGDYGNSFLRGVVGKSEKQVFKIACVLHALKEWAPNGSKSSVIAEDDLSDAIVIFAQCMRTYTAAADSKGFVGESSEVTRLIDYMQNRAERKKKLCMSVGQLRDAIKKTKPFDGQPGLTAHLRDKLLPELERLNYIVVDPVTDNVFINPRLK